MQAICLPQQTLTKTLSVLCKKIFPIDSQLAQFNATATMLRPGRSRVPIPIETRDFSAKITEWLFGPHDLLLIEHRGSFPEDTAERA